jgi:hypothetical protein
LATGADGIDDGEEFSRDMTNQLATFAHPGIHASIFQDGMQGTVAAKAAQVPSSAAIKGPIVKSMPGMV